MNRARIGLAVLSPLLLAPATIDGSIAPLPIWTSWALLGLGAVLQIVGATMHRPRIHAGGLVFLAAAAAGTGLQVEGWVLFAAAWGLVLALGSWSLAMVGVEARHALLLPAALLTGLLAALLGWLAARGLAAISGGGSDALAGIAATLALVGAVTWAIARWALRRPAKSGS